MTPLAAVMQPETIDTAACAGLWSRHLAAIRAYYGDAWFAGRSVLSLARDGDIGELASLGARLVGVPAGFDPDQEWACGEVDLVLHLGVLPQLCPSFASLRHACAHATHLVVETGVCDSHDDDLVVCIEREPTSFGTRRPNDENLSRPATRGPKDGNLSSPEPRVPSPGIYPSPARIERLLAEHGMLFQRLADSRCNGPAQVYDWLAAGTGRVTPGQRRLWFARRG